MENNYWIVDDLLIFKPKFNGELNKYDIINKYSEIIFSNYDEPLISIETDNQYYKQYRKNYIYNIGITLDKNFLDLLFKNLPLL